MYHHRQSLRLARYLYTNHGDYFVTFLTKNRATCLSHIVQAKIQLTPSGTLVQKTIMTYIKKAQTITISDVAIMPNHVHCIVSIKNARPKIYTTPNEPRRRISPAPESLGSIVRTIKAISARHIRKENPSFAWHRNYYERIIRNDTALTAIKRYIALNPQRWHEKYNVRA